ncbi:MAG: HDOD domain-containing protein [Spirochaetia bacterium]|nr:HDOD domain-containing protein [Spirochaetia bacterium]
MESAVLKIRQLPVLPQIATHILNLNEDMSFTELERMVKSDQAISTLILKAANSTFYARNGNVKTIPQAGTLMGIKMIRSLILLAASKSMFKGTNARFKELVWKHSLATAALARKVALDLKRNDMAEEAFMAGLLHDIGKAVLSENDRQKFVEVINMVVTRSVPFEVAELEIFGLTHMDAGLYAVKAWNLPAVFAAAARSTDQIPEDISMREAGIVRLIRYANFLAKASGNGHRTQGMDESISPVRMELGISEESHAQWIKKTPAILSSDEFFQFAASLE